MTDSQFQTINYQLFFIYVILIAGFIGVLTLLNDIRRNRKP